MPVRIEVRFRQGMVDAAGEGLRARAASDLGVELSAARTVEAYCVDTDLSHLQIDKLGKELLADPLTQEYSATGFRDTDFDWAIEIGFLPGVTDNVGTTTRKALTELLGIELPADRKVYHSRVYLLSGCPDEQTAHSIASRFSNPLINRVGCKSRAGMASDSGMGLALPRVTLPPSDRVVEVDLEVEDEELGRLSREGIVDRFDTATNRPVRRGPLALDPDQMAAIRDHYRALGRKPTDVELESLAQTWSEHCKHTIFAARIDDVDSLYATCIKGATERVRRMKGSADPCLSVFSDNAGVVRFTRDWNVCYKVETHNSPSALDPYGGAVTGIVGVNRDPLGTGKGAQLVMNMYGFCFANPFMTDPLPTRDASGATPVLHPKVIFEGVRKGVEDGGNKSGIPTPLGFIVFDDRYLGKPLVFVGTLGLMPSHLGGSPSHQKRARAGDFIVVAGGRVGKDGIHGATFSSEGLHEGSPAGAVQIGDPITQKKLGDAQLEARDLGLYSSVTDCGAGGISCSVGEMARESGGCEVDLDLVPVKYPGLAPWEIWISESQERMTYAVPPETADELLDLFRRRDVEATIIGRFTNSGRCVVRLRGTRIVDLDLGFLHDGLPRKTLSSSWTPPVLRSPRVPPSADPGSELVRMMGRLNLCSREFVVRQYDHEVQGGSVIKPLCGVHQDVHNDAAVVRPLLGSNEGVALSTGILPWLGDIDTGAMAAACIDTALRGVVAVGGDPDTACLLDNFCWCSSDEPERLGQLKRAALACHDTAVAYGAPFVSGKDSMFNDFKGWGADGVPVKISVPPTILISALAHVPDVGECVDLQAMRPGDLVYVIGTTHEELGGSEWLAMSLSGGREATSPGQAGLVPAVRPDEFMMIYRAVHAAIRKGLVASCASVGRGGLGAALARTAMAGDLGIVGDLGKAGARGIDRSDFALFSESQGRFLVTVDPARRSDFEMELGSVPVHAIGEITGVRRILLKGLGGRGDVDANLDDLRRSYRATLDW